MTTTTRHGIASWVDLTTPDVDESQAFYRELFGWSYASIDSPTQSYYVASTGDIEVGGMTSHPPERATAPAYWAVFFHVDDVDKTAAAALAAGGAIEVAPFEIPGGRAGVIADPGGARFVIRAGRDDRELFSMDQGAVSWVELMTRAPESASAFYADVFGWSTASDDVGNGVTYTTYSQGDAAVGGMIETPSHVPAEIPDNWSIYFNVDDCTSTATRATTLGGEVLLPSTPTEMGPFAVIADPQGAVFQIMQFLHTA